MAECIICHKEKDERMPRCMCAECEKVQRAQEDANTRRAYSSYSSYSYNKSNPIADWFVHNITWFVTAAVVFFFVWVCYGNPFASIHTETAKVLDKQIGYWNMMYVSLEVNGERDLYRVNSDHVYAELKTGETRKIDIRADRIVDVK